MSDRLLVEAEMEEDDPSDIDAVTLDEVVERVKESYGSQAEERVRGVTNEYQRRLAETEARAQAATVHAEAVERTIAEKMRRRELAIEGRSRAWARLVTRSFQYLIAAIVVAGAIALISGHPFHGGLLGIVVGVAIVVFVVLELIGILRHLSDWRASFEVRLGIRLRGWLSGDAESGQGPVG
jgi:ABC-type transport system involved in cytochrome bd biosynthesis fused ATPase/permease subunit